MLRDLTSIRTPLNKWRLFGGHAEEFSTTSLLPEILTPEQYYAAPVTSPCHRLLVAILEDAIRSFKANLGAANMRRRVLFTEAKQWLFDSDGTAFLSCPIVCESLGIDPVLLRRHLREWQVKMAAGEETRRSSRRSAAFLDLHITAPRDYRPRRRTNLPSWPLVRSKPQIAEQAP